MQKERPWDKQTKAWGTQHVFNPNQPDKQSKTPLKSALSGHPPHPPCLLLFIAVITFSHFMSLYYKCEYVHWFFFKKAHKSKLHLTVCWFLYHCSFLCVVRETLLNWNCRNSSKQKVKSSRTQGRPQEKPNWGSHPILPSISKINSSMPTWSRQDSAGAPAEITVPHTLAE